MKPVPPSWRLAFGVAACLAATGSWALSLGRTQGVATIGRPLEVSVPVQLDAAGGEGLPECVEAEVFYGDTRIGRGRVDTTVEQARSGGLVRIRSAVTVNEPVVTLYLHLGCTNRSTRRLVLLAEHADPLVDAAATSAAAGALPRATPGGVPPSAGPAAGAAARATPRTAPRGQSAGSDASRAAPVTAAGPVPPAAPADQTSTPARPAAAARTRPAATPAPVAAAPRRAAPAPARLQLDPVDLLAPLEPTLRLSDALAAPAETSGQQRAAATALWRALNAQPEEVLRDARRMEGLEADLRTLRQSVQRNDLALADLRRQLTQAQDERYMNPLVMFLALLALGACGLAAWTWRQAAAARSAQRQWWGAHEVDSEFAAPGSGIGGPGSTLRAAADLRAYRAVGIDTSPETDPLTAAPAPRPVAAPAVARPAGASFRASQHVDDFQTSQASSVRALKVEELHDLQQEADFFMSLGEHDRAVAVLRSHIGANPQTSAIAWMDLMEIFHKLDRRAEFDAVCDEFQRAFNARVPAFEAFRDEGDGLENYRSAIGRIVALWPSRRVLEVIEESIFREPGGDGAPPFSLQAYRELLLLHHIGTEVFGRPAGPTAFADSINPGRRQFTASTFGDSRTPDFAHTAIRPLSAAAGLDSRPGLLDSRPGVLAPALVLDLNLDDPAPANEARMDDDAPGAAQASSLLDFDLPDIDLSTFKTRKSGDAGT